MKNLILLFVLFLMFSCLDKDEQYKDGKKLAKIYCASCHLFPLPSILPSEVWEKGVLPKMGLRMGRYKHGKTRYDFDPSIKGVKPNISQEDWKKIVEYYTKLAPSKIKANHAKVKSKSTIFNPEVFSYNDKLSNVITMTFFDELTKKLYLGDAINSSLATLNANGEILDIKKMESPPVKILFKDSLEYILSIGSLNPSDSPLGKLKIGNNWINNLIRPVDFLVQDINSDGYDDVLVCNYGNSVGDFSIYKNLKNGRYKKEVISSRSGAIKVDYTNIDNDSDKEIIVLFAQEHESLMIWDYKNNSFTSHKAIQFQPAFGSVDFQLKDMDGDGDKDVIIGNGDNADYSRVLKNFHGIRVFINLGEKKFHEAYFYPFLGVSKIEVEDFDLDGDMDILAISNFGDFSNLDFKSVRLLRNDKNLNFEPQFIENLPDYKWQTLDVSDFDSDGDLDVFISALNMNIGPIESNISDKKKITWVKLENTINPNP